MSITSSRYGVCAAAAAAMQRIRHQAGSKASIFQCFTLQMKIRAFTGYAHCWLCTAVHSVCTHAVPGTTSNEFPYHTMNGKFLFTVYEIGTYILIRSLRFNFES